jgi:methionyl-tRNA formyltransferase
MKNPRVIFAGTPEFARASLAALVTSGVEPVAVLTQPDRPAGRGKRLTPGPVKRFAEAHGLPVMQPKTLRDDDVVAELASLEPDLMIVAAYGLLLPQRVLDIPRRGCINVHASLLPRWRGAAPIQAAILAGDETSGITLMSMTAGLDCGPVIVAESLPIAENETAGSLHGRLAGLGAKLLVKHLADILDGTITVKPQDEARATHAPKIAKADARLDWARDASELERQVRAYNPVPGAYFFADIKDQSLRIKCWRARCLDDANAAAGTVVESGADGIDVACANGVLRLVELQLPGRRPVTAAEFAQQLDLRGQVVG